MPGTRWAGRIDRVDVAPDAGSGERFVVIGLQKTARR